MNYKAASINYEGQTKTLFELAAEHGSHKALKALTQAFTPKVAMEKLKIVEYAMISGSSETIDFVTSLLDDINTILDAQGNTVAHYLVKYGLLTLIEEFHKKGLNFVLKNKSN